jgi:hypothetical protein
LFHQLGDRAHLCSVVVVSFQGGNFGGECLDDPADECPEPPGCRDKE